MDSNNENVNVSSETMKVNTRKTIWDPDTHTTFVALCMEEVKNGNKSGSTFTKVGWTNIANNLKTKTGKVFNKQQFKNHWDSMKRDWKLYDRLMRIESGLGWDPIKKTINAPPAWWDEKIEANLDLAKFRGKNLEMYHMYYGPLFGDSVAIGDRTKTPSQIQNEVDPNNFQGEIGSVNVEEKDDSDEVNLGDDVEITFPESSLAKRKKTHRNDNSRIKKVKNVAASSFEVKLDTVLQALSSRSTQVTQPVPSIAECMDIVSSFPGFEPSSVPYNKAMQIFMKKEARECFMYPPTTVDKINFLYSLMNE